MTPIAEAAAFLAPSLAVFPCDQNKRPLTPRGLYDATRDPDEARRLFAHPAAALIGVPTGATNELFAVDLDTKNGAPGLEWLARNRHRLPATRTHSTPSGGLHLLFRWPHGRNLRNSASKVAPGVDVRAQGGYVCAPPSPGYTITDSANPAEAPAWLLDLLDPPAALPPPREPYAPPSGDRSRYAEAALDGECSNVASAPEGSRNATLNNAAVKLGSLVASGLLSESTVRAELRRAALHAGLEPRETDLTIQSGLSYGMQHPRQIPERAAPLRQPLEIRAASNSDQTEPAEKAEAPRIITPGEAQPFPTLTLDEIEALPPPSWLIEGLLVEASNASLIAPPKSLKSFLALDWALHLAYGIPWHGRPVKQCGVIYMAGEGVGGMARRIAAWRAFHGCSGNNAPFRLIAVPFRILDARHVASAAATAKFVMEADGHKVGLYVNDTLARSMAGADENSAQDMGRAVEGMDTIKASTGATMLSVHHTGKDADRGARGSSALLGAVDTEITVKRTDSLLAIKVTAQKDAEEGDEIHVRAQKVGLDGREPVEGKPSSLVLLKAESGPAPEEPRGPRLTPGARFALSALHEVLIEAGQTGTNRDIPRDKKAVPLDFWRREFYARSHLDNTDAKRKAFLRAVADLREASQVVVRNDYVWLADAPTEDDSNVI